MFASAPGTSVFVCVCVSVSVCVCVCLSEREKEKVKNQRAGVHVYICLGVALTGKPLSRRCLSSKAWEIPTTKNQCV